MVEAGGAVAEDSALVWGPVGGIDGDGDGAASQGVGQGSASSVVGVAGDLEGAGVGGAASLNGLVWVGGLGGDSVVLDVFEGVVHKTTVAGLVAI